MGILSTLKAGPLALDTAIFIYFMEEHPRYLALVDPLFAAVDLGMRCLARPERQTLLF